MDILVFFLLGNGNFFSSLACCYVTLASQRLLNQTHTSAVYASVSQTGVHESGSGPKRPALL